MTPATKANFIKWVIAYWEKNPKLLKPPDEILTQSQQIAIAVYKEIPADGSYVKASAIAKKLNKKPSQIREILGLIKNPWGLRSNTNNKEGGYGK